MSTEPLAPILCGVDKNEVLRAKLPELKQRCSILAMEFLAIGQMAGGPEFRTCWWAGRFAEAWGMDDYREVTRTDVKMHLLGTMRGGDPQVRAVMCHMFGGDPSKTAQKGLLNGFKSHAWQALAAGVTWWQTKGKFENEAKELYLTAEAEW